MQKQQKIIILSSTTGGGKDTITKILLATDSRLKKTISCATRKKRAKEKDGVDYYFISKKIFKKKVDADEFLEWEKVHNFLYGTLKTEIKNNKIPILVIDVKGGLNIKKMFSQSLLIFIKPNSLQNIIDRIKKRAAISEQEIKIRLGSAKKELKMAKYYDHIITNPEGHPEKAAKQALKIIEKYLN